MDSLHITIPGSDDPYSNFNPNKRASVSSIRSGSFSSPYEPSSDLLSFNGDQQTNTQRRPSAKKGGVSTFITKLYTMVEDGRHQNLISWNPHGTSFYVCNATQFAQEVLPEYFKHSNFSSFVRLLNMYGFHKINKSPRGQRGNNENEIWEFSHPNFQHGRLDLLKDIKRKAMDSELLRRETGDIHASFTTLQMSQADLLQQFYILQENFSNLLQGFEETKRLQTQQQAIIMKLAERQGLSPSELLKMHGELGATDRHSSPHHLEELQRSGHNSTTESPLTVFVTSPNNEQETYNPLQLMNDHGLQHPLQPAPDVTMSIYEHSNSPSPASMSPNMFETAVNTPLPPSPVPSAMMGSPLLNDNNNNRQEFPRYEDMNTLGLGLS